MSRSRTALALALPFGFVVGQVASYGLARHDEAGKATNLAGHGYLGTVSTVAVLLLLASVPGALWNGRRGEGFDLHFLSIASPLVAGFALIEIMEHLVVGASVAHIITAPTLWIGLIAQLGIAFVLCSALRAIYRVGERLAGAGPAPVGRVLPASVAVDDGARAPLVTSISGRGPPVRV